MARLLVLRSADAAPCSLQRLVPHRLLRGRCG